MTVIVRPPRRPDESDEDFKARDEAHWKAVAEAEKKILALRANRLPPVDRGEREAGH